MTLLVVCIRRQGARLDGCCLGGPLRFANRALVLPLILDRRRACVWRSFSNERTRYPVDLAARGDTPIPKIIYPPDGGRSNDTAEGELLTRGRVDGVHA